MDKKENLKQYLKDFAVYLNIITIFLFILQLLIFIIAFMTKISFIVFTLIFGFLAIFSFTILKEYTNDEKVKKSAFLFFKLSLILFVISAINDLLWLFIGAIDSSVLSLLPILADAGVFLVVFSIMHSPEQKFKIALDDFYKSDFDTFKENLKKNDVKNNVGSAIIGKNVESHEQVVIPLKDRYLHMLILGPTGSGKTSQTILPLIYNDIRIKGDDKLGIIVLEPKGDLAEKVNAMCKMFHRKGQYFNPMLKDCPYFNPLMGSETDVIENFVTSFNAFASDSSSFFRDGNEVLLRRAITVCYRLVKDKFEKKLSKKEYPTLLDLDTILNNTAGRGEQMMKEFIKITTYDARTKKEHDDISAWFFDDYYTVTQGRVSKSYENTSGARTTLTKIISNKYLRDVLCPPDVLTEEEESRGFVDFRKCLANGEIITISSAEGDLRDLGKFLGYFLILNLQSAVFSRPGNENTRRGCMLYIDEFQTYANNQFADMLTKGRSYRVAVHLATQNRALIGMNSGKQASAFTQLVDTNCRNLILYPGGNPDDAKYYSAKFGEETYIDRQVSTSRQQFNPLYGWMMRAPSTTEREVETTKARFSPSEIMYRPFGEITYSIIQNNTLQAPGVSRIEYIPYQINQELDVMIADYNEKQLVDSSEIKITSLYELEKDETAKNRNLFTSIEEEEDDYDDESEDISIIDEVDDDFKYEDSSADDFELIDEEIIPETEIEIENDTNQNIDIEAFRKKYGVFEEKKTSIEDDDEIYEDEDL